MRHWLIPLIISSLSLISILILGSIAPELTTNQVIFSVTSGILFFLISRIRFERILKFSTLIYVSIIVLLLTSLAYGQFAGQTGRWIPILGGFNAQPSQLAVLATSLSLLSIKKSLNTFAGLTLALTMVTIPAVLILIEPDLGTTLVYLISTVSIIFLSKISWQKIISLLSLAVIGIALSWSFILKPYQKQRLTSFTNPQQDSQGASYNARQAVIAVGSGRVFGKGLGQGVQSHLKFLPERQTDFIFASLAEEFGFIGSIILILLYTTLIGTTIYAGLISRDQLKLRYCLGTATLIMSQTIVNIGMNIGLLPITGLTLPFLSYGGSSFLSLILMLSLVQSIINYSEPKALLHLT
jgi:rod shape determining protein RodA